MVVVNLVPKFCVEENLGDRARKFWPTKNPIACTFFRFYRILQLAAALEKREREKLSRYHITETHQENAINGEQAIFKAKESTGKMEG